MQTGSTVYRQDIADVLEENNLGRGMFAGTEIMPILPVGAKSGQFAKIAFASIKTKAVDDKKATSGNYNEVNHETTSDTYTCIKRGLEEPVDDDDAITLGKYFNAEVAAAGNLEYYLRLNREARIAAIAFSTSVMSSYTSAVTTAWSTAATCTPIADVELAKENIITNLNGMSGSESRLIGVGNLTARRYLRASADIRGTVYSGGNVNRGNITDEMIAAELGLDAVYFSGLKRGGSDIWNAGRFGVYQVSTSDLIKTVPQFGRTMLWRDSTPNDMVVESYRSDPRESEIIRVKHNTVEKSLTLRAGYLLTNIS